MVDDVDVPILNVEPREVLLRVLGVIYVLEDDKGATFGVLGVTTVKSMVTSRGRRVRRGGECGEKVRRTRMMTCLYRGIQGEYAFPLTNEDNYSVHLHSDLTDGAIFSE